LKTRSIQDQVRLWEDAEKEPANLQLSTNHIWDFGRILQNIAGEEKNWLIHNDQRSYFTHSKRFFHILSNQNDSSHLIRNLWKMILFDKGPQYFSHTFNDLINHIIPEKSDHYMQVLSVVYARLSFSSYSFNKSEDSSLKRFINLSRNNLSDTTNGRVKLKFFLRRKSFFSRNCTTWALGMILFSSTWYENWLFHINRMSASV
jgi:hypothetical protein